MSPAEVDTAVLPTRYPAVIARRRRMLFEAQNEQELSQRIYR